MRSDQSHLADVGAGFRAGSRVEDRIETDRGQCLAVMRGWDAGGRERSGRLNHREVEVLDSDQAEERPFQQVPGSDLDASGRRKGGDI